MNKKNGTLAALPSSIHHLSNRARAAARLLNQPRAAARFANRRHAAALAAVTAWFLVAVVVFAGYLLTPITSAAPNDSARTLYIRAGTIETVSGGTIRNGAIVVREGRIVAVGPSLPVPEGAQVLSHPEAIVTPGLIETVAHTGLLEIEMESSTVDNDAANSKDFVRAAYRTVDSFQPRSVVLPIVRSGGVTSLVAVPVGGLVSGNSLWADLKGPPGHAQVVQPLLALHANLGNAGARYLGGARGMAFVRLRELFADARGFARDPKSYQSNRLRASGTSVLDLVAIGRVISGRQPLVLRVNRADEIERAVNFFQAQKVRGIIVGAAEGHLAGKTLAAAQIPVIVDPLDSLPADYEKLRARPDNAALMAKTGVRLILSTMDGYDSRHRAHLLAHMAGNAIRHGLSRDLALRAVTLEPARAFGMEKTRGAIAVGLLANLVIWEGDPFETSGAARLVIIRGELCDPGNRHKDLLRRYRKVPPQYDQPLP